MRELKFRIWDRQAKAWAENDCSLHCFSNWQIDPFTGQLTDFVGAIDGDHETRYNANPAPDYYFRGSEIVNEPRYVVVQFTGLKDKNGKEIYEGDIVNAEKEAFDSRYKTNYRTDKYTGVIRWHHSYWSIGEYKLFVMNNESFEIIGNINENPELLEQ